MRRFLVMMIIIDIEIGKPNYRARIPSACEYESQSECYTHSRLYLLTVNQANSLYSNTPI